MCAIICTVQAWGYLIIIILLISSTCLLVFVCEYCTAFYSIPQKKFSGSKLGAMRRRVQTLARKMILFIMKSLFRVLILRGKLLCCHCSLCVMLIPMWCDRRLIPYFRQFPSIADARQAISYRETFDTLYPQYLKLHEHYRLAWDKVITLRDEIIALNDGRDNQRMARLAKELDDFLNQMRKPERREEEVRLLVMSHQLRHLKLKLAEYAARIQGTSSAAATTANHHSLRTGASD